MKRYRVFFKVRDKQDYIVVSANNAQHAMDVARGSVPEGATILRAELY